MMKMFTLLESGSPVFTCPADLFLSAVVMRENGKNTIDVLHMKTRNAKTHVKVRVNFKYNLTAENTLACALKKLNSDA